MNKKEQKKAIENLVYNLDELSNKPRRLFSSLREFTEAFIDNEEKGNDILDKIDEFEGYHYSLVMMPNLIEDLMRAKFEVDLELTSRNKNKRKSEEEWRKYCYNVEWATKEYSKKILEIVMEYLKK